MRGIAAITLMGLLAQGCIIYEERYHKHDRDDDGTVIDPTTDDGWTDPGTTDPTTDPGPTVTTDFFLTVDAGEPGDTLLSTLESTVADYDLHDVTTIEFGRDVQVLDRITREHEIVLLLQVHEDALPGLVDVFVETEPGDAWILESPFIVLDPADAGTGTDGTGTGTGTDGTDTGTGTGTDPGTDTGCDCTCP